MATPASGTPATVGGNLGYAEPASDPAPALLCAEADVVVAGPDGRRTLAITDFFTGFYATALAAGELVVGLRVPRLPAGARSSYVSTARARTRTSRSVGVAALVVPAARRAGSTRSDRARRRRAPTVRARGAEARLHGRVVDDTAIREAAEMAASGASRSLDLMGSADYRREMVRSGFAGCSQRV